MKKEELVQLGLSEELAAKVAEASAEELKAMVPKTRLDEVIAQRDALKGQVTERDAQIEKLSKSAGDNQALKDEIAKLQESNKAAAKQYEESMAKLKLDNAVDLALAGASARNAKAVKALLDLSKSTVGEDGKVAGLDDQLKALKTSDPYLFADSQQQGQKQFTGVTPQSGTSGTTPKATKDMTYAELCDYIAAGGQV